MKKITINKLYCEHQITAPGNDDVFILVQLDGGPPKRHKIVGTYEMPKNSPVSPDADFYFETNAYISLWDRDGVANFINSADMCGTFNIPNSISNGSHTYYTLGDHNAKYRMDFEIEEVDSAPPIQSLGTYTTDVASALGTLQGKLTTILNDWDDMSEVLGMTETSELNDAISGAISGGLIDSIITWLQDPSILALLPVKAISLGIMGQAEIFVGISGNFGCAADLTNLSPENFDDNYAIYAGGGFAEGADAGAEVDLALGIWFEEVSDIGGFLVGAEVDIADGAGFTAVAYGGAEDEEEKSEFLDAENEDKIKLAKVIFLGIDIGLDEGVEAEETYFFSGHLESAQVSQDGDFDHQAILNWITCKNMHKDDKDEVYFHFYADGDDTQYRYPIWNEVEMDDQHHNSSVNPTNIYYNPDNNQPNASNMKSYRPGGQMVQFNEYFEIHLHVNDDETIHTFHLSDFTGSNNMAAKEFNGDGYSYEVKFYLAK